MLCGEVTILLSDVFKVARSRVKNLNIACDVFITPDLAEIVEAAAH